MGKYAVIGMGRFGQSLAVELSSMNHEVLCVDSTEDELDEVRDLVSHVTIADATDEDAVRSLGLEDFDCVCIAIGHDIESSVLCAIICKDLGIKKLWAKASVLHHGKILDRIGVDKVILPERDMGIRVAHQMVNSSLIDYIALSDEHEIVELQAKSQWVGKSLIDINFRTKYGINVIGIKNSHGFTVSPEGTYCITEEDVLTIIGENKDIEKL